ncbi:MAG: RNA methyltransferase [Candidatus Cloacimonetes bacterium]|nr:RNA methyltransferase [Candidatus Cloacimonadota bacterium]MBL7108222.1 RNA methyltransferase [Candidatus Cloacimonadota bacterium]
MIENLFVGLVHFPVYNRNHKIVATSITNIDLHDISRSCKTFGVKKFFIINPQKSQKEIFMRLKKFWQTDFAKEYNINRFDAFEIMEFYHDIKSVKFWIKNNYKKNPIIISTSARKCEDNVNFSEVKNRIQESIPKLILFGTGYGLSDELIKNCDINLSPIIGEKNYNHLSVRSAIAIILDRLISNYK